ncbi:MAG: AbrB/MazE/SpoVT family DNA-binding domain-containing protein [Rubrivivax sp.]|nr:MAG: AbrB/MazE/SpoVT family DNA-binding domain-containing protein [Rubrivivax sp.]
MQLAKWGNSLALRIPSDVVRQLGLREGATVEARLTVDGSLSIRTTHWNRQAFAVELTGAWQGLPVSDSVMEQLRHGARY